MRPSENPFRSRAIAHQRYQISESELSNLADKAAELQFRARITGPHGTGKSTLLEDLAAILSQRDYQLEFLSLHNASRIGERWRALRTLLFASKESIYLLDGGESLSWPIWRGVNFWIRLRRLSLLATTHQSCSLTELYRTQIDPYTMLTLSKKLAGKFWNSDIQAIAVETYKQHQGNCREVFRACYWYCSMLPDKILPFENAE